MRILHVLSELDNGGVAHILYDYCSRLSDRIDFDFVVSSSKKGMIEEQLIDLGCNVYHIPQIRGNLRKRNNELKRIIKNGEYDIVHDHSDYKGIFTMMIAKQCHIKTRISHSHRTVISESNRHIVLYKVLIQLTKLFSTDLCACGNDAAIGVWGNRTFNTGKVFIVRNGIDVDKYEFSQKNRDDYRSKLKVGDSILICNVGRFVFQKNQEFLVKIMGALIEKNKDVMLALIGNGEDEDRIKRIVELNGLNNHVLFLGSRNDVPQLLSAMDVFVLPSRYEGLPIVLVEVQANGLPAVVSSAVTKEICLLDNIQYLSLEESPQKWADVILEIANRRINSNEKLEVYNIKNNCYDLEAFYRKCISKNS